MCMHMVVNSPAAVMHNWKDGKANNNFRGVGASSCLNPGVLATVNHNPNWVPVGGLTTPRHHMWQNGRMW